MIKYYQAVLMPVHDPIKYVYGDMDITLEERMGDSKCPECKESEWWILPAECIMRKEGGKAYIECINCGYQTHL